MVFVMPTVLQELSNYRTWDGIEPKKLFHDLRDYERFKRDKMGIPSTSFEKKLNLFTARPEITFCVESKE